MYLKQQKSLSRHILFHKQASSILLSFLFLQHTCTNYLKTSWKSCDDNIRFLGSTGKLSPVTQPPVPSSTHGSHPLALRLSSNLASLSLSLLHLLIERSFDLGANCHQPIWQLKVGCTYSTPVEPQVALSWVLIWKTFVMMLNSLVDWSLKGPLCLIPTTPVQ